MLKLTIPASEQFDDRTQEFITGKEVTLQLEHSLVSLSKWEAKWEKPYLSEKHLTVEETLDYVRCMTLTQNVNPEVYRRLSRENIEEINRYIRAAMSATRPKKREDGQGRPEVLTAEKIYALMIELGIPFECQKWHLNRLITLIRVCQLRNHPPKKRSQSQLQKRNTELNAKRRKQHNTRG